MKSYISKPSEVTRKWYLIDAEGKTLGRISTEIARLLRGKHKVTFTPHVDGGDFVIVVNADKVVVTGNKTDDKIYRRHTGYIGNMKSFSFEKLQQRAPGRVVELAIKGMLPKNTLGRKQGMKLHVYAGAEHPHAAQQPDRKSVV